MELRGTAPGVGAIITVEGKRRRLNGGTAEHKSWEKHAWQNCHGPTLRPENMSPSTSMFPSTSLPFSSSMHSLALALSSFTEPCSFCSLMYSSKLPGPSSFTATFLRTVELQWTTSLSFMRFFIRLLPRLPFWLKHQSKSRTGEVNFLC